MVPHKRAVKVESRLGKELQVNTYHVTVSSMKGAGETETIEVDPGATVGTCVRTVVPSIDPAQCVLRMQGRVVSPDEPVTDWATITVAPKSVPGGA